MQYYWNLFKVSEKCYFSSIAWPILILFVLSDRAGWGLQNIYTEFWNSLITQIYANLFKINTNTASLFLDQFWLCLFYLIGLGGGFKTTAELINYANLFKNNEKCYFSISWPILILFVLSDRAWWGLRNFYTELWNSLIMQNYANLFKINKNATSRLFMKINAIPQICISGGDVYYASRNLLIHLLLFFWDSLYTRIRDSERSMINATTRERRLQRRFDYGYWNVFPILGKVISAATVVSNSILSVICLCKVQTLLFHSFEISFRCAIVLFSVLPLLIFLYCIL